MVLDRKLYDSVLIAVEIRINDLKKIMPMGAGPLCKNQLEDLIAASALLRKGLNYKETVYNE